MNDDMMVIPAILQVLEAEIRRIMVQGQPRERKS
jgi:hypothetical protein